MAENNMVNLKVFLRGDNISEARRFTVDASVATSFLFMREKLQTVFPVLRESDFKITWKDMDGDEITIASDDDFITAFTEMNGTVKVLYVTAGVIPNEIFVEVEAENPFHGHGPRVICDVCNQIITGFRYKCLQCPDYDLCSGCEHQGNHSEHMMMRVPTNETYIPKCARKFMHHLTRNLKKSAYHAGKEAHRAAKFASKFATGGRAAGEENKDQPSTSNNTQNENQEQSRGCPFASAGATAGNFNMDDVHALGAMARQHFGPFFEAFQNPAAQPGAGPNQGAAFVDILRNAVDGFFGRGPEDQPTNQQGQEQQKAQQEPQTPSNNGGQNKESSSTPMDTSAARPPQTPQQNNGNGQNNVGVQSIPMDTSGNVPRSIPLLPGTGTAPPPVNSEQRRDPGWTFVATTPTQSNENTTSTNAQAQPNAPTFVYHENPKIAEGLVTLHEMGFSTESVNPIYLTHLLERFNGDVAKVVKVLIDGTGI